MIHLLPVPLIILALLQGVFAIVSWRRQASAISIGLLISGFAMSLLLAGTIYGIIFFYGL